LSAISAANSESVPLTDIASPSLITREYIEDHLGAVEYRTIAFVTADEAKASERELIAKRDDYLFKT